MIAESFPCCAGPGQRNQRGLLAFPRSDLLSSPAPPRRGAWLWIGTEMIHLMELPNPDPLVGRPEHGGRDRHFCIGLDDLDVLVSALEAAGVPYTRSKSGRAAVFFRDPDSNTIEAVETDWGTWRREGPSAEDRE